MRALFPVFALLFPCAVQAGILEQLPTWPITNIGDQIPDELILNWSGITNKTLDGTPITGHWCPRIKGHFSSFPSKVPVTKPDQERDGNYDPKDPDTLCDDGDQTTFNGMLCAAGIESGCRAVAEAQDETGRFFRSPHRRWMWNTRCKDSTLPAKIYNDRCAYGFSPDMNLGVLLYVIKKRDVERYVSWLNWLNAEAATTTLCRKKGEDFVDCVKVEWPRVCPEDMGHGQNADFPIFDRYGGKCVLRPLDALDFAAINNALAIAAPSRISNWETTSSSVIKGITDQFGKVIPTINILTNSPLVLMSLVDEVNFSLHLDAIRILMRMLILNPSMELNNLPTLPDIEAAIPSLMASESVNAGSIHASAVILANRNPSNPFIRLLAEGPSPSVRSLILDKCPAKSDSPDNKEWLWELPPGHPHGDKLHSMGWDCAFVATLYNKMRIRKDIVDELLYTFLRYADPIDFQLRQANQLLQIAEAATALAQKGLDEAERGLQKAIDFVGGGYEIRRRAAKELVDMLDRELANLNNEAVDLEEKIREMHNKIVTLPDQIQGEAIETVCKALPWPLSELCGPVRVVRNFVNQTKIDIIRQETSLEDRLTHIRTGLIDDVRSRSTKAAKDLIDLETQFKELELKLISKELELSVKGARAQLEIKSKALAEARKLVAELRRADAQLKARLAIWRNDNSSSAILVEPPASAPTDVTKNEETNIPSRSDAHLEGDSKYPKLSVPLEGRVYFSVVGSVHTRTGAFRHASHIKRKYPYTDLNVFLPHKKSRYWIVTSAHLTTLQDARIHANNARRSGLAKDAFVLRLPGALQ